MILKSFVVFIFVNPLVSADNNLRAHLQDPKTVVIKKQKQDDCKVTPNVPFRSQYREDETIYRTFFADPPICGGTVVEMGGLDGIRYSNSWFFQYALGWNALLVEASPTNFEQMVQNRPDAINIFGAMCLGEATIQFRATDNMAAGGVVKDMSHKHKNRWANDNNQIVDVPCMLVSKTLLDNGIDHVDAFFLDVEGAELSVLQTIEWGGKVKIDMFIVEMDGTNGPKNAAVRTLLRSQGYITPFSTLTECVKFQSQCMPSDLFILEGVWNEKKQHAVSDA